jgi:flavodoxin
LKTLIICFSYHHMNTQKVASTIAGVLGAEVKAPQEVDPAGLSAYDLVGFGSGIYMRKHHSSLLELADKLPQANGQKAFVFSTSGQPHNGEKLNRKLREKLQAKGYKIVGDFNCPGLDTYGALKLLGGSQKGHPDEADLKAAAAFTESLKEKV